MNNLEFIQKAIARPVSVPPLLEEGLLLESLNIRELLGIYYIWSYVYYRIPPGRQGDELTVLKMRVKEDLKETCNEILRKLEEKYADWVSFHLTAPHFIGAMLYVGPDTHPIFTGSGEDAGTLRISTPRGSYCVPGGRIQLRTLTFFRDYQPRRAIARGYGVAWDRDWGHKVLLVATYAYHQQYASTSDKQVAGDRALYADVELLYNEVFFNSRTKRKHELYNVTHAYWEYLENGKWKSWNLGDKVAYISHLLNVAHHSGSMAEGLGVSAEYLDKLSALGEKFPEGVDAGTLKKLYHNWQQYLP